MKKREEKSKRKREMEEILEKGEPLRNANWSREIFMEEKENVSIRALYTKSETDRRT